eukprot:979664-Rhodomonas_salina.2
MSETQQGHDLSALSLSVSLSLSLSTFPVHTRAISFFFPALPLVADLAPGCGLLLMPLSYLILSYLVLSRDLILRRDLIPSCPAT